MIHTQVWSSALASLALLALTAPAGAQFEAHQLNNGRVALHFEPTLLENCGLTVSDVLETDSISDGLIEATELPLIGFAIDSSSDLLFLTNPEGGFVPYGVLGGSLHTLGGFTLSSPSTGRSVDLHDFVVDVSDVRNDGPGGQPDPDYFHLSRASVAAQGESDFKLCYVKIAYDPNGLPYGGSGPADHNQPVLRIKAWDLIITETLARDLGRPDLTNRLIGSGKIDGLPIAYDGPWAYPPGQNPETPYAGGGDGEGSGPADAVGIDVKLGILSSITAQGHTGTFPNGRVGLATSTTSCNVGTVQVDWLAPMNEHHPGITQALFRQMGNRFEQVGIAWAKHGFFALSNSQCTPCQGGSPQGKFLGIGCSDTYGTSNNGDRFYLAPREEWNPFTDHWTACGSFFDGVPADCLRDEDGSGFGPVDHRLEAFDYDLNLPDATYFYEGNYLIQGDVDKSNNIGSRKCTMTWNGSTWTFATPTTSNTLLAGPAINRYGEMRSTVGLAPADGNVVLAVQTADLGGGLFRYEYALYNWDLNRKVRAVSVPCCGSASDFYFHDIDDQPSNDWVPVVAGGNVTWTFPDVTLTGVKVAGPLSYATLYNFGFTSDVPPGPRDAALTIHDAGAGGDLLAAATMAPACLDLSATSLAPPVSTPFSFVLTGGTASGMFALVEVNGIPLASPVLLGPVPFVSGQASLPISAPPSASGLSLLLIGAEVETSPLHVVQLSDLLTVKIQ
ncbi:MAG TPA: hypothetical protein VFF36_04945 [Planctomycetota bacterium]|nr:hypothetical protein [Planctomycetota bacterium]